MGQVKCVNVTCRECTVNEFECQPGECINITSKCDGSIDCIEGTDEINCRMYLLTSIYKISYTEFRKIQKVVTIYFVHLFID